MWAAIVSFALGVVQWLFGQRQQAEGEAQGKAEEAAAGSAKELSDVQKADAAAAAVAVAPAGELRRDDGFRRDD